MANAFDIDKVIKNGVDQNVDTHLLNETFHVFSKSPASNGTTLGGARLKSGHTTTASDVWADEIPAFFSAANQAKFDLFSTLAVKDDLCIFGGKVYQHNGTQFVSLGTEAEVLVDGATFQKNNKDVIKYHKNRTAINLTADNNNGDGSNNLSAKIYDAATGSTNFVSQFISSTDKMVAGVPSLAYDATVIAGGVKLAEGLTNDNDYICNAYAGVIQFNKERSSGVTVSAWEYIGDKLTTSISSIRQSIKDISDVTLKGVVASVTADENTAQKAGIIVDNTVSTTPVIKFTAGSVAANETKLVTGGAVKTYVDTTALASGGSIAKYVEDYVATNAKVSVNGQSATTITVAGTAEGSADLVKVVVTEDKTTTDKIGLTLTATLDAAVLNEDGSIDKDGVVIATIAKDIAESVADTAITNAITTDNGAIKDAIDGAISAATLADADNAIASATGDAAEKLVTAEQVKEYVDENAKVTLTAATAVGSTGITINPNATESTSFTIGIDQTVIATKKSVDDLSSLVSGLPATIQAAQDAADDAMEEAQKKVASVTGPATGLVTVSGDKEVTITVSDTIATKSDITTEINKLSAADGIITTLTTRVNAAEASASASEAAAKSAQSAAEAAQGEATASKTAAEAAQAASEAAQSASESAASNASASATAASQSASAAQTAQEQATASAQSASSSAQSAADSEAAALQAAADAKAAKEFVETTAVWQAGTDDTLGNFTTNASGVVTGTTVKTVADEVLTLAKSYSDSLHTTSLDYVVLGDSESLPRASAETLGKIYLLKEGNNSNLETGVDAISGDYVEYMTRKVSETEYTWEKIGTTAADLSAYAKTADLNVTSTTANGLTYSQTNGVVSVSVDAATTSKVGTVQLTDGYTSTDDTKAATGKSIATAIDALDSSKSVNGITVNQENGVITSVTEELITASVPEGTTKVEGNVAYVGSTKHVIAPEKFQTAAQMPTTLTSWVADLSNLTNGDNMFSGCTGLTTFVGDLSSLTSGVGMFINCHLNEESLEIIADTLPEVTGSPEINLGLFDTATGTLSEI